MIINGATPKLAILIGILGYLSACQMPTETFNEEPNPGEPTAETISHDYVEGVTPENVHPDSAERTYTIVQANWDGPGGDKKWLGMNLGAKHAADTFVDNRAESSGWYFQFNHTQGLYPENGNDEKVEYHIPGNTNGRQDPELDSDWIGNDPCQLLLGDNWRIPTENEWLAVAQAGAESDLNLHYSGYILGSLSFLSERGAEGFYWSNTQSVVGANSAVSVHLNDTADLSVSNKPMYTGMPVRCIED